MTRSLSVVMPVYNEAPHLAATVEALVDAVRRSGFDAELVLVDDGSSDGSAEVVRATLADRLPLTVVAQENRGRLEARRAGVEAATADSVLLLDGRVLVDPGALEFVRPRLEAGARVWTSHVRIEDDRNLYGVFWRLLAELAWGDYFDNPRTTSFDASEFDRYPKGTTCFLAPKGLLLEAIESFRSGYSDSRHANDDTPLLRWISERQRINVSPEFGCRYTARSTLRGFVRHSVHRGVVFLDGHGRIESRFFPAVVLFYPLSLAAFALGARRPRRLAVLAVGVAASAASAGALKGKRGRELEALALLSPLYAASHGAGMWRGLLMIAARKLRG